MREQLWSIINGCWVTYGLVVHPVDEKMRLITNLFGFWTNLSGVQNMGHILDFGTNLSKIQRKKFRISNTYKVTFPVLFPKWLEYQFWRLIILTLDASCSQIKMNLRWLSWLTTYYICSGSSELLIIMWYNRNKGSFFDNFQRNILRTNFSKELFRFCDFL